MSKKPDIETFIEVLRKTGGNLTQTAAAFKVVRGTIYSWAKEDVEFRAAIADERKSLVDECLVSARVLALGIPEKDENGKFVGWRERPDGQMIRYLLSTLGRDEGFGDKVNVELEGKHVDGIQIEIIDRRDQVDRDKEDELVANGGHKSRFSH